MIEPGTEIAHSCVDGGHVVMMHDAVYIYSPDDEEIVSWTIDEWKEDIDAVTATLNAISIALRYGTDKLPLTRPFNI